MDKSIKESIMMMADHNSLKNHAIEPTRVCDLVRRVQIADVGLRCTFQRTGSSPG